MNEKFVNILAVSVLAVLGLSIFCNSMFKPLGRDEQMYCTAGYMQSQGKLIYRDFPYVTHMPYHPLICAGLYKLTGTNHYLLTARLFSVFCDIATAICIVLIFRNVFRGYEISGTLAGLFGAIFFVFNSAVSYMSGYAWNHDVVVFCVVLSYLLFMWYDFKNGSSVFCTAAIGALLTIATFMRATTILVYLIFFIMLFLLPAESLKKRIKNILPFLAGTAVFLIWPIWVIIQGPRAFYLNVFRIPQLNSEYSRQMEIVRSKANLTIISLTEPGYFLLFVAAIFFGVTIFLLRRKLVVTDGRKAILAVLLSLVFFVIAYIPPSIWFQYFGVPVAFVIISFSYPLLYLRKLKSSGRPDIYFRTAYTLLAAFSIATMILNITPMKNMIRLFDIGQWEPIKIHNMSREVMSQVKGSQLILTLSPVYAIEGGGEIYPELSAGTFAYRVADALSESQREITHTVGVSSISVLLKTRPPDAVIIGSESRDFEVAAIKKAISEHWEKRISNKNFEVYFKR
ncbi:MAG: ArnT family glycosyltransferase [Planctomycetota bacterium]|jgi:hypothetical protein